MTVTCLALAVAALGITALLLIAAGGVVGVVVVPYVRRRLM
jgi:hypothetical protein